MVLIPLCTLCTHLRPMIWKVTSFTYQATSSPTDTFPSPSTDSEKPPIIFLYSFRYGSRFFFLYASIIFSSSSTSSWLRVSPDEKAATNAGSDPPKFSSTKQRLFSARNCSGKTKEVTMPFTFWNSPLLQSFFKME